MTNMLPYSDILPPGSLLPISEHNSDTITHPQTLSSNLATFQTQTVQQPMPVFAEGLFNELKSTDQINQLAKVMNRVFETITKLRADDIDDVYMTNTKTQLDEFFKPYQTIMNKVQTPTEKIPEITFEHPEWTYETYMDYLHKEDMLEQHYFPAPFGRGFIDNRPSKPSNWNPQTNQYDMLLSRPFVEAVEAREAIPADPANNVQAQAAVIPVKKQTYLPPRRGYPAIKTGAPLLYTGNPLVDKENECILYIGTKNNPDNIDVPQTLISFQSFANSIGYSPALAKQFLERLCKIKWGENGYDPYKDIQTPTEIANKIMKVTFRPKTLDDIEKVNNFIRPVNENIQITYNRLIQAFQQCLAYMPNETERDLQVTRKADIGILNLIHPALQVKIKANRSLSNYQNSKYNITWELHYIELSESHAKHLRPQAPLRLSTDIEGINVNNISLYETQLPTAFPALFAGVKRPLNDDDPNQWTPDQKKYKYNEPTVPTNPISKTNNSFDTSKTTKPTQGSSTVTPPTTRKTPSPSPIRTILNKQKPRTPSTDTTAGLISPTTKRRIWHSPTGTRRFSASPGGTEIIKYDRTSKKFHRVPTSTKPLSKDTPSIPPTPRTSTNPPNTQPPQIPNYNPSSRFSPQRGPPIFPNGMPLRSRSTTPTNQNQPTTGNAPPFRQYGTSPNRPPTPNGFQQNRYTSPNNTTRYTSYPSRQPSRSPSPGPGRPRYNSSNRPNRYNQSQNRNYSRPITPNTAYRQTKYNMYGILDRRNIEYWFEKICRYCNKKGHSAAICANIICTKCKMTGKHYHDYHCLLARQKHNLLMTYANPNPRQSSQFYRTPSRPFRTPSNPNRQPNNPPTTNQQTQPMVNNMNLTKETLLPMVSQAIQEALPKCLEVQSDPPPNTDPTGPKN